MSETDRRQLSLIKIWMIANGKKFVEKKCLSCGEDDINNFYRDMPTMCIACHKKRVIKRKLKYKRRKIPIQERIDKAYENNR